MQESDFGGLLELIYAAPGSAEAWTRTALATARHFNSAHAHLVMLDPAATPLLHFVTLPEAGEEYVAHYGTLDVGMRRMFGGPERQATTNTDVMSADELKRCPVQQEFLPRFESEQRMWVKDGLGEAPRLVTTVIRAPGQGAFEVGERRRFEIVSSHLDRAMRLHLELQRSQALAASLEQGLEQLSSGFLLLDRSGRVMFANAAARAMMDERRALGFERGRLRAWARGEDASLQAALTGALRGGRGARTMTLHGQGGEPVVVRVIRLTPGHAVLSDNGCVVVLLSDAAGRFEVDPELLQGLGLTRTQARLTAALARGSSLEAYASAHGLRLSSVRSTLRDVFTRTGTHRQSELLLLALRHGLVR